MSRAPQVFTVLSGRSFVDALAEGLLERYGADPAALGRVTVLLPTRRAVKALGEAFLRQTGGRALILPALRPLGDVDEDEILFSPATAAADIGLPPPVPPLWRQIMLTRLVDAWATRLPGGATSPAQSAELAAALARFLDEVHTEGLDFAALGDLVPDEYAAHWQSTLEFLTIITAEWPEIVAGAGFMDAAERRNRLLLSLADLWAEAPPAGPVIAAGSTGSIPATAALLAVIARLPEGALVLPGLDLAMDDESWEAVGPTHPQFTMKELLAKVGAVRAEVRDWSGGAPVTSAARRAFFGEVMRPAETTAAWRWLKIDATALDGLHRIDAPSAREEAGAIALLMREVLETPEKTAALVTLDRNLARRVAAELERWGVEIDDSAGTPLGLTPPGVFLALAAEMVATGFAPVPLLAALKHPLAAGGETPGRFRASVRELEAAVLRGARPPAGSKGMKKAIAAIAREPLRERLGAWWQGLEPVWTGFAALSGRTVPLSALVEAHLRMCEALAATDDTPGPERLWAGEAGDAAARFMEELLDASGDFTLAGADYPAVLKVLMSGRPVRPRYGRHPRLKIWGPLEARLQHADLVILGGLNEGAWPPDPGVDPWLSRPMRAAFGLPALERRIGLSAHDFVEAATAPAVVLTRAAKIDGTPTVPSRWLMRMDAVLGETALVTGPALGWFAALDEPARVRPCPPPTPRPPVAARPRRLSVTQVQTWLRDPYAVYARHILGLKPLDPLDADPGAAEKGTIIHAALEIFLKAHPGVLPADAFERLVAIGEQTFGALLARPAVRAFWWPRFVHVAEWFVAHERERRQNVRLLGNEGWGEWALPALRDESGAPFDFLLVAKADRIDGLGSDVGGGGLAIIDYKTGQAPGERQLMAGYAPQLPLEALMAEAGAFNGIAAAPVAALEFWRLHGGDPPAVVSAVRDVEAVKRLAHKGLFDLVTRFARAETPYVSLPKPENTPAGDYDHLARIKEWSGVGGLLDGEGGND